MRKDEITSVKNSVNKTLELEQDLFITKLKERFFFEKNAAQLYEALLKKFHTSEEKAGLPQVEKLEQFYKEEIHHMEVTLEILQNIGADLTLLGPKSQSTESISKNWIKVLNDAQSSFLECLEITLQLELVDHSDWEILIELAEENGQPEMAIRFQRALDEESYHLSLVKQWVLELNLNHEISVTSGIVVIDEKIEEFAETEEDTKIKH